MANTQARIGHQALAALDVALRVPCIFIIDAIFNSYYDAGFGWAGAIGKLLIRITGVFISIVVLLLSQRALFKFYALFFAVLLGVTAVLFNYYSTSHTDIYSFYYKAASGFQLLPKNGPTLWMGMAFVQLIFILGYVKLWCIAIIESVQFILNLLISTNNNLQCFAPHVTSSLLFCSGVVTTSAALYRVGEVITPSCSFWPTHQVHLLVYTLFFFGHGCQLLRDLKVCRYPTVIRFFFRARVPSGSGLRFVVLQAMHQTPLGHMLSWDVFWDLSSNLIISGCDSTLTVLGMSAVISSVAHYLGLSILAFIAGSTEEEDKRLGFVAPVLFFILALQTGLSSLDPEERLVRLSRNMCLLLTAILHFIHGMTDPVLMSLSASHVYTVRRHFPVLLVSIALFVLPVVLSYALWHNYALNTWLFAVTAFCVELCLKVVVSLTVYGLFMVDGFSNVLWEKLDDYVYYVRSTGNIIEFLFGVVMFGNGAYTMMFESGSKIRACMMCLHAYFNIYLQAKNGWKTFINRRTAVKKINSLPEVCGDHLTDIDDVCAICYQEFSSSARITPCHHYFHALCLRKWLYIQDTCPMCHQRVYVEENNRERAAYSNNNGGYAEPHDPAVADPPAPVELDNELLEDNDSIEYDEEEWGTQNGSTLIEEDYINDDTD
uniref:E3 ubiquitin-protein ligase RNF139 n=1 Tax=Tetraodon nigroviridis TaxID=99883 RepID=H3BYX5_TETNG